MDFISVVGEETLTELCMQRKDFEERASKLRVWSLKSGGLKGVVEVLRDDVENLDLENFHPFAPIARCCLRGIELPASLADPKDENPVSLFEIALASGSARVLYLVRVSIAKLPRDAADVADRREAFVKLAENRIYRRENDEPSLNNILFCKHILAMYLAHHYRVDSPCPQEALFNRFVEALFGYADVEDLVEDENFDANFAASFATPLELAVYLDDYDAVFYLLRAGALPNVGKLTPPLSLCWSSDVAYLLLAWGADAPPAAPEDCWNAYEIAILNGDHDLAGRFAALARPSSACAAAIRSVDLEGEGREVGCTELLAYVIRDCGAAPDVATFVALLRDLPPESVHDFLALLPNPADSVSRLDAATFASFPPPTVAAIEGLYAAVTRRAARALVKATMHAVYRPDGPGAVAARERFELARNRRLREGF